MALSVPVAIALLIVYAAVTIYTLRRHHTMQVASDDEVEAWSFKVSLAALGVATVVTAFVAEILVGSLKVFAEQAGLSEFFVAAVIVAIVGNAAEHGGAVVVAARGKIKLAAEIALSSSAQVAVFLIPAVVAPLVADRATRARLPPGRDRGPRTLARRRDGGDLARRLVDLPRARPHRGVRRRRGDVLRRRERLSTVYANVDGSRVSG